MYKVFFNEKVVYLTGNKSMVDLTSKGLVYYYHKKKGLKEIINHFREFSKIKKLVIYSRDLDKLWRKFQGNFDLIEAAGGVVRNEQNDILFIKRRGLWDLPKGKKENGEQINDCAVREVKEECGIKQIDLIDLATITYHTYTLKDELILKKTYWYNMVCSSNEHLIPQKEEDITEIKWISPVDISLIKGNTFSSINDVLIACENDKN